MMRFKRKKAVRLRGSKTHGWGAKKKHRGAGNRGGRGRAGSGKRGDAKKPSYWKIPLPKGFYHQGMVREKTVNLLWIEEKYQGLLGSHLASEKEERTEIDITKLGFSKLLSKGTPTRKYRIIADSASGGAVKKVERSGGQVILKKDLNKQAPASQG